ncbi:hypothetical protein C8J57DRAFT_1223186 [Mycena rebaudengoi]|nr:hypothetical protein C8J57DRAFT_1223186 [Mycena rebaudengoi]
MPTRLPRPNGLRPDIPSPPPSSFLLLLSSLATDRGTARPHPPRDHGGAHPRLRGATTRIAKLSAGSIKQKRGAHGEQRKTRGVTDTSTSAGIPKPAPTRHNDDVQRERKSGPHWCARSGV